MASQGRICAVILAVWSILTLFINAVHVKEQLQRLQAGVPRSIMVGETRVSSNEPDIVRAISRSSDFVRRLPTGNVLVVFSNSLGADRITYGLFQLRVDLYPNRFDAAVLGHRSELRKISLGPGGHRLLPMDASSYAHVVLLGIPSLRLPGIDAVGIKISPEVTVFERTGG